MKLRVAYLVSRFPKTSETFIVDEVIALEEAGVEVPLYALADGRGAIIGEKAAGLAARCIRISPGSPRLFFAELRWLWRSPARLVEIWGRVLARHLRTPRELARSIVAVAYAVAFADHLQRMNVQHLHAHFATHTALAAWVIHRLTGLSYSFTAHADDIFVMRPMLEEKVRDAAFVVTISDYNRGFLLEQVAGACETPIEVVRCGVSAEEFGPVDGPAWCAPFEIACVARLEPKKGHADLLDACAKLALRGVDFRCRFVGEGSLRKELEDRIRRLGLVDRAFLLGAQPREKVREVMAAAHVVVSPSVVDASGRADGIPVALMEAMAMCRPVVTTRVTGIPELVEDEVTGLLVSPGEPEALADAIGRVLADSELARRLALGGRERVLEAHDLGRNVGRLRDLFNTYGGSRRHPKSMAEGLSSEAHGEAR